MLTRTILLGLAPLRIDDVSDIARGRAVLALDPDPAFRARIDRSARLVAETLAREGVIYGVTTGYGDSCTVAVADTPRRSWVG